MDVPTFEAVKYFTSASSSTSIVPASLRAFAHKRCKEEVEIENLRIRAGGATGGLSGGSEDLGDALPTLSAKVKAKVKVKAAPPGAGAGNG